MSKILAPRQAVAGLSGYDPGRQEAAISLVANENPYDLPADLKAEILAAARQVPFNRYPDPLALDLRAAIAARFEVDVANVAVGNGGDDLLMALLLAYGGAGRTAVTFEPTFVMYAILSAVTGTACAKFAREGEFALPRDAPAKVRSAGADIVFVCSPNNPTGNLAGEKEVVALLDGGALVVVDEAYGEFSGASLTGLLCAYPNLAVLRTFSKAFSLAGLRVGYLLAASEIIDNIFKVKLPYNVNAFSQAAAVLLLEQSAAFDGAIAEISAERDRVFAGLDRIDGLTPYRSAANFVLVKSAGAGSGRALWRDLLDRGILVRAFEGAAGLEDCLRITIGKPAENTALLEAVAEIFSRGGR